MSFKLAYNHNNRPCHDNCAQEYSWSDLANENGHGWLEENVRHKEHEHNN
jgi:hypothetical protein